MSGVMPVTIVEAATMLRNGKLTSLALTEAMLDRADQLDERLGVYISRSDAMARNAAMMADRELGEGSDRGLLHGIPVAVKDVLTTEDAPTTAQSRVLLPGPKHLRFDAYSVARLRAAGAVVIGKTTTMEFARGRPDFDGPFPIPRNPWDLDRWTGGSSSGTASGVAAGLFLGGLGTDTGGSIRLPASFCGVTGLKPSYGLVSLHGCIPLATTLDHVGPIARTARDCAVILTAIAGFDVSDPASMRTEPKDYSAVLSGEVSGLVVGIDRASGVALAGVDSEVKAAFESALVVLQQAGARVKPIHVPRLEEMIIASDIVSSVEAFAYHRPTLRARWNEFGSDTRLTLAAGAGYIAADYAWALRTLERARAEIAGIFESVDVLATPTTARPADRLQDLGGNGGIPRPRFTRPWNGYRLPALSVPMGFTKRGLPVGMQIIGGFLRDDLVLQVGDAFQSRTDWHLQSPRLLDGDWQPDAVVSEGQWGESGEMAQASQPTIGE